MDVVHLYERPIGSLAASTGVSELAAVAAGVEPAVKRDMRAEGLEVAAWWIELELLDQLTGQNAVTRRRLEESWEELVRILLQGLEPSISVVALRVYASARVPHPDVAAFEIEGTDSSAALIGSRPIILDESGPRDSPVYEWERLRPGNRVFGPAIVEGLDTTVLVPSAFELVMNSNLDAVLDAATGGA